MSDIVIKAEGLGKRYVLGQRQAYKTLRETLRRAAAAPVRALSRAQHSAGQVSSERILWALEDISFEVRSGEVLGVIGRNGAGKSTLLKVLSRITQPTVGRAVIRGKVGSLLEVGTGFHSELTGRENIFLSGAIIGMKRAEINRKLDDIVAFSDIEQFLDTPVKRYSSGMYVRLAFAVAAHLEPEILLVDEVLAVGDLAFQKKCLGKMGDVAHEGRTVLFVSHNMQAVSTLTDRALLLSKGTTAMLGPTPAVLDRYMREAEPSEAVFVAEPSTIEPRVTRVGVSTSDPNNLQSSGAPMEIHLDIDSPVAIRHASVSIQIADALGRPLAHLWSYETDLDVCNKAGTYHLVCTIPNIRLYMGRYSLIVHFSDAVSRVKYQTLSEICPFEVVLYGMNRDHYPWAEGEMVYFEEAHWKVERTPEGSEEAT